MTPPYTPRDYIPWYETIVYLMFGWQNMLLRLCEEVVSLWQRLRKRG